MDFFATNKMAKVEAIEEQPSPKHSAESNPYIECADGAIKPIKMIPVLQESKHFRLFMDSPTPNVTSGIGTGGAGTGGAGTGGAGTGGAGTGGAATCTIGTATAGTGTGGTGTGGTGTGTGTGGTGTGTSGTGTDGTSSGTSGAATGGAATGGAATGGAATGGAATGGAATGGRVVNIKEEPHQLDKKEISDVMAHLNGYPGWIPPTERGVTFLQNLLNAFAIGELSE